MAETKKTVENESNVKKTKNALFRCQASDYYRPGLERLRLILMFLLCINLFGFPTSIGGLFKTFCGFVPIAFFILSGYLVLRESEQRSERIIRTIKRTAIVFVALIIFYFIVNLIYYRSLGFNIFTAFTSKRMWFNFVVLNVWPFDIGTAIWYVQSLLYAYIIIYFLNKWKLLRYDWLIAIVLIIFAVSTGELAGLIRWSFLGYNHLVGNFMTRALPYVLIGCFIHRKYNAFDKISSWIYVLAIPVGALLMFLEIIGLAVLGHPGYYGHLIGMPIVAVSICMIAIKTSEDLGFENILGMSRWHINCIYYLCQPVSLVVVLLLSIIGTEALSVGSEFLGIITFLICFIVAWFIAFINRVISKEKDYV